MTNWDAEKGRILAISKRRLMAKVQLRGSFQDDLLGLLLRAIRMGAVGHVQILLGLPGFDPSARGNAALKLAQGKPSLRALLLQHPRVAKRKLMQEASPAALLGLAAWDQEAFQIFLEG